MLNSHLIKQVAWLTSKSPSALYALCEKLKKIIFLPVCFLSHHLLSKGVGLLALMRYNGKAMFKELFLSAAQPFIKHHSSLSTPGVAGTALVSEKSPDLPCRGCQPAPFCRCAQAGFVRRAAGCWPCCVRLLHTAHLERRTAASPAHLLVRMEPSSNLMAQLLRRLLPDTTRKVLGKLPAFCTHQQWRASWFQPAERKELLEEEGPGLRINTSQLVSSSVSLDQ